MADYVNARHNYDCRRIGLETRRINARRARIAFISQRKNTSIACNGNYPLPLCTAALCPIFRLQPRYLTENARLAIAKFYSRKWHYLLPAGDATLLRENKPRGAGKKIARRAFLTRCTMIIFYITYVARSFEIESRKNARRETDVSKKIYAPRATATMLQTILKMTLCNRRWLNVGHFYRAH